MTVKILKLPSVIERVGLSRSAIYSYIKKGNFPQQVHLGEKSTGWIESEINEWIAQKINKRDGATC